MAFMDFLLGKEAKPTTKPVYGLPGSPHENILSQLLEGLQQQIPSGLQNLQNILGGSPEDLQAFERPARRAFEQETLPTIAERFTGTFGTGSQQSSAFGQALGTAGRELEENLAAKRFGLQSGALEQLMRLLEPAFSPQQYQYTKPRESGLLENLLSSTVGPLGKSISGGISSGLGSLLKLLFGGNQATEPEPERIIA